MLSTVEGYASLIRILRPVEHLSAGLALRRFSESIWAYAWYSSVFRVYRDSTGFWENALLGRNDVAQPISLRQEGTTGGVRVPAHRTQETCS